jgi:hypothetical protein
MAAKKKSENVGDSVQQSDRLTTGRRRQEKRVGSGNTRGSGQALSEKKAEETGRQSGAKKRK